MDRLNIPIILGSSRPNSRSKKVADLILEIANENSELDTKLVGVNDFEVPFDEDTSVPGYDKLVRQADAFVLVFPEYNHSFPGRLKSLLDTEFGEYKHKLVMLASVSSGDFGGARAVESIIPVLTRVGLIFADIVLYFPRVKDVFDEQGNPTDEKVKERVERKLEELVYITKVIKYGKEIIDNQQ